jgi:capsular polysaccharide biosynthesis protein
MTIDEAVHRVVRGHWRLILICLALPVAAVLYLASTQPTMYEAVGRLQFGTTLASSNVEADAASTRALGIVTSPGVVEQALSEAQMTDDPAQFALDHIVVRRVGVSPVVEVAVSQQNPETAAHIARSLTNQLLKFANSGDRQNEIGQVESLDATIVTLTKQRAALIPKLANASPGGQLSLQAQISAIQTTLADDLQQRSNLIVAAASRSSTALLDAVRTPTVPLSKSTMQMSALAALLGLIGGLGLAAGLETLRPTLRDPKAVSYAVGAPVIGHLLFNDLQSPPRAAAMDRMADRMALLGLRHETARVLLLSVRSADAPLGVEMAEALSADGEARTSHRLHCAALNRQWVDPGDHPAIVIFSPSKIRARELRPVQELIDAVDWPVLGVVTYDRPRNFTRRRADRAAAQAAHVAEVAEHVAEHVVEVADQATDPAPGGVAEPVVAPVTQAMAQRRSG